MLVDDGGIFRQHTQYFHISSKRQRHKFATCKLRFSTQSHSLSPAPTHSTNRNMPHACNRCTSTLKRIRNLQANNHLRKVTPPFAIRRASGAHKLLVWREWNSLWIASSEVSSIFFYVQECPLVLSGISAAGLAKAHKKLNARCCCLNCVWGDIEGPGAVWIKLGFTWILVCSNGHRRYITSGITHISWDH